jgi:hypothetical protein
MRTLSKVEVEQAILTRVVEISDVQSDSIGVHNLS